MDPEHRLTLEASYRAFENGQSLPHHYLFIHCIHSIPPLHLLAYDALKRALY